MFVELSGRKDITVIGILPSDYMPVLQPVVNNLIGPDIGAVDKFRGSQHALHLSHLLGVLFDPPVRLLLINQTRFGTLDFYIHFRGVNPFCWYV